MINDGITWAEFESFTDNIIDLLFNFGDFIYAGTSQDGKIFRSNDGKIWTEVGFWGGIVVDNQEI